ncbi:MAG: ABC transporter permease [Bifidobacteriaceae bacterium]|jgi:simple sugar transport system permease protein|nr:ABC transporter permease [Bifidobacteriaceae bacterium]
MTSALLSPAKGPATEPLASPLAPISYKAPVAFGLLTLIAVGGFGFGLGSTARTKFSLASKTDFFQLPNFAVPSQFAVIVLCVLMMALTALSFYSALNRHKTKAWLASLFGLSWVLAFMVWVIADKPATWTIPALLAASLSLSIPLVFGSLTGLVCERVGVINVAIEGQLLFGAFLAAIVASVGGSAYWGLVAAPLAGALVGALLALFAVKYWVDHIIVGIVLNVLMTGLTSYLYSTVLSNNPELNKAMQLPKLPIPLLGDIPVIGPVLFRQSLLVYLMYGLIVVLNVMLFRSRWGLRMRACGEHPEAADTVGIKVNRTRIRNTILGGSIAGLGGAFFTVEMGLAFGKEMSAGKGFIALAAMILGRWNPKGAVAAALLFGFANELAQMMGTMNTPIPSNILLMIPYVLTILAVAGLVGQVRAPAAEGGFYRD